jgi:hypothetical protein
VSRFGRIVSVALGVLAVCLLVLAFSWGGWAGEAVFVVALALLVTLGVVLLACRAHRPT